MRFFLLLPLLLGLAACNSAGTTDRVSIGTTAEIASMGTQLSVQRAGNGILRPLIQNPALQAAAAAHADDLNNSGQFSHTGSDGSDVQTRVRRAGYNWCFVAENIAQGQPDVRSVVSAWMASPDHRANILSAQATQFGFARTGDIWVLVVARPC
jgi:uncharacterized protein YkwD